MEDQAVFREIQRLDTRIDKVEISLGVLDLHGSRGVGALQVQLGEVIKDLGILESTFKSEMKSIKANRYWLTGAFLTAILPIYSLLISIALNKP